MSGNSVIDFLTVNFDSEIILVDITGGSSPTMTPLPSLTYDNKLNFRNDPLNTVTVEVISNLSVIDPDFG